MILCHGVKCQGQVCSITFKLHIKVVENERRDPIDFLSQGQLQHSVFKNSWAQYRLQFFRAQEPKAPVTYCDHALSGVRPSVRPSSVRPSSVRLFTFSTSSPEPLDGF